MDSSVFYRLKNLTNNSIISISKDIFKIGRSPTNDLSINENPYLSSSHCTFQHENGQIFLLDTSSNGTLINRTQKVQKNVDRVELHTGDILHLVFRKDSPESNVIFQIDIPSLSPFDEETQIVDYRSIPPASPDKTHENSPSYEPKPNVTPEEPKREFAMDAGEDMEDVLTCVCCQDIMSNPITLEPCLHAFCTDCYVSWEAIQRTCPKCRVKVTGKKKNVVINGILEAYLKAFPHKRPQPRIDDESEKTNKTLYPIGPDGMYLDNIHHDDDEEPMEEYDEDEEDEDDDDDVQHGQNPFYAPAFVAPPLAVAAPPPVFQYRCRHCPPAVGLFAFNNPFATTLTAAGAFQCPPGQNHILCQCCMQPMPDRRDEADIYQHCHICHQFFCNMYFKPCGRAGCQGCLNRLRDFQFSPRHLNNLVNDNPVESQIIQDFLINHQLTMRDLLVRCCDRLDRNEFQLAALANTAVPSSKVVCYKCGLNLFKQLAYEFRVRMTADEIHPIALRQRENCHYGRHCRTQFNKLAHAQKFNHACDQTKF